MRGNGPHPGQTVAEGGGSGADLELSCFISPHGLGHATRTIALLQALHERLPEIRARVFTLAPETLFKASGIPCEYHRLATDVGLAQFDALNEDPATTAALLADLIPFKDSLVARCAKACRRSRLIICDISCLGIAVARRAGIPSLLVENFTWDWIYSGLDGGARLQPYAEYFCRWYRQADFRLQTEPVCRPAAASLRCGPMARKPLRARAQVREELAAAGRKVVLVSMGGLPLDLPFVERLGHLRSHLFVIAGQRGNGAIGDNVRLLAADTPLYHPDLIAGADLLVCKSGYSTIAECCQTGTPICCVARERFPESAVIERYVTTEMDGTVIDPGSFLQGAWLDHLDRLCRPPGRSRPANGAGRAAELVASLLRG